MATQNGRESAPLIERLFDEGFRFDFFQAVRVLDRYRRRHVDAESRSARQPVGRDSPAADEMIRFRSSPSFGFPASEVAHVERGTPINPDDAASVSGPMRVCVLFMGLTGPSGVLPDHYTRLLCDRLRQGDAALHDFLDMFQHRLVSLFYRAGERNSVVLSHENAHFHADATADRLATMLRSLIGFGTGFLRDRLVAPEQALLYYAGHYADQGRPILGLRDLSEDYFGCPIAIEQFHGCWLQIDDPDQSRLPARENPHGHHARLGRDLVIGTRVWDVQSRIVVRIGPLDYQKFLRFLPIGDLCKSLHQLVRLYVGYDIDVEIRPVLKADQVPDLLLRADPLAAESPRLGWNSWSVTATPQTNPSNVLFSLD